MSFLSSFRHKTVGSPQDGRGIPWKALSVWLLCLLPAVLIFLNNTSVVALRHERKVLTGFGCVANGFECDLHIGPGWLTWADMPGSKTVILENGKPLAIQDSYNADIASKGWGRYNVLNEWVVFSSSDNSDPRTNGRVYEIDGILKFPRGVVWSSYALAAIATFMVLFFCRSWFGFILSYLLGFNTRFVRDGVLNPVDIRRPSWKVVIIWFLFFFPAVLIFLNNNSLLPLRHEKKVLKGFGCVENGFACDINIGAGWLTWGDMSGSPTFILENGKPLPIQDTYNAYIAAKGRGRYNVLNEWAVFSSSDNSDPRTNGRVYEIDGVLKFPRVVSWASYFLAFVVTFMIVIFYRSWFGSMLSCLLDSDARLVSGRFLNLIFSYRPSWKVVVIWLVCLFSAVLIFLNNKSILPLRQERKVLTDFVCVANGFACDLPVGQGWVNRADMSGARTVILEDGKPLLFQDSNNADIIAQGKGRYNVFEEWAVFSSSDNSDPRTNGRVYEIDGVLKFPRAVTWGSYLLAFVATCMIAFSCRRWFGFKSSYLPDSNARFVRGGASNPGAACKPSDKVVLPAVNLTFYVSVLILVALFLMTRLWFFVDYPFPGFYTDTSSYYHLIDGSGPLLFTVRPPLYLLLLKIAYSLTDMNMTVVALQTILSLAGGVVMVYAVWRVRPVLSIPTAIVFALWIAGYGPFEYDTSLMSESLYTTMLVLSFGLLLLGIYKERPLILALSSASMAGVILTRPAGIFLIVTYFMVLAFLLRMRYSRVKIAAFLIPFPALLLSLCFYNYLTARVFAITAFGGANITVVTLSYWEQDGNYPPRVNEGIVKAQASMGKRREYMEIIRSSSNPYNVAGVILEGGHEPQYSLAMSIDFGDATADTVDKWLRKISFDAIKKHPDLYANGVKAMLDLYFRQVERDEDFISTIKERVRFFNVDARPWWATPAITKEYANPVNMDGVSVTGSGANAQIVIKPTGLLKAYQMIHDVRRYIFARAAWSIVPFVVFLVSVVMLIRSRARSKGAFFIFILTTAVIGASLIVCLVEYSNMPRYPYPTEFIYYLALVFSPLIFMKDERDDEKGK